MPLNDYAERPPYTSEAIVHVAFGLELVQMRFDTVSVLAE
jgi:hypothetical protein